MSDEFTPKQPKKRRFRDNDWKRMAEEIWQEKQDRASRRADLEKIWKEVDRQVRMEAIPRTSGNKDAPENVWLPQIELSLQVSSHETHVADIRRLLFPRDRSWFKVRGAITDDWLDKTDFQSLLAGDNSGVPSVMGQEEADGIAEAALHFYHNAYDFRGAWDALNGEALKYGAFCGRFKTVEKPIFYDTYRGLVRDNATLPVIVPRSMWSTYLDDSSHAAMSEGMMLAPAVIECHKQKLDDLLMAAASGSADPESEQGGWRKDVVKGLAPVRKADKEVELIEYEGDIVVPRSEGNPMFLPNSLVTVVVAEGGPKVVRYRVSKLPFRSYFSQAYHSTDLRSPYGVGPLMMGAPLHNVATDSMNDLMECAALNARPPLAWNPDDYHLEATGGPKLYPGASFPAKSGVVPLKFADPTAMMQVYSANVDQYRDTTGTQRPRLGAQTKSHTTAYSTDAEMSRGLVRTVDYVSSLMSGAMPNWLSMEYEMARRLLKNQVVYAPRWKTFLEISGKHLPEYAMFEVYGAAGPAEEREAEQKRTNALLTLLKSVPLAAQAGVTVDVREILTRLLEEAGFADTETIVSAVNAGNQTGAGGPQGQPELPGGPGILPKP